MNTVYLCQYCREPHDRSTRSVEHIIPEALGNQTLKLPDVCKYWNNFFAASFETPVVSGAFMQLVAREYRLSRPPNGAHRVEEVTTARGTTEYVWRVNGKEVLRDMPVRVRKNTIDFPALDKAGNEHLVPITLPFEYVVGTKGDETERADVTAKADRDMKRLLEYLQALAQDPGLDPALAEVLEQRQLSLRVPNSVNYDIEVRQVSNGGAVSDIEPKAHAIDRELWGKFYLKIGWCFACHKLGSSRLATMEDAVTLRLLKSGAVDPELVALCASEAPESVERLFRQATPGGVGLWLWRPSIRDADAIVQSLPETVEPFVRVALEQRKVDAIHVKTRVDFRQAGRLDRKETRPTGTERTHRLRLEKIVCGDRAALGCAITLFDGVFEVMTQLTPLVSPDALAGIEFEEEIRLPAPR